MQIKITFLGGSNYWQDKITKNAEIASRILSDPRFIAFVSAWHGFDYTDKTPEQVTELIKNAGTVSINVGFYSKWWTRAIAYEDRGAVYFNTRKEAYGAGSLSNLVHEVMHALGFGHNGNSPEGNQNTVPYRIGEWAGVWKLTPPVTQPLLNWTHMGGFQAKERCKKDLPAYYLR